MDLQTVMQTINPKDTVIALKSVIYFMFIDAAKSDWKELAREIARFLRMGQTML
jgi:predicted O-methyltransferase YrrM